MHGEKNLHVLNMMSLSLDLPDKDYEWMQLSGAWSRERYIKNRTLEQGITAIDSMRGNSSHEHNPFLALKRHNTDENAGEVNRNKPCIQRKFPYAGRSRYT